MLAKPVSSFCNKKLPAHKLKKQGLTSKVSDGKVLVLVVLPRGLEGELLASAGQVLVFSVERLDYLFSTQTPKSDYMTLACCCFLYVCSLNWQRN